MKTFLPAKRRLHPAFVEPVSLITLGLIALALVVSIPYISGKNVQILRYNPDALIRQRERTGECKGSECLVPKLTAPTQPTTPTPVKTKRTECDGWWNRNNSLCYPVNAEFKNGQDTYQVQPGGTIIKKAVQEQPIPKPAALSKPTDLARQINTRWEKQLERIKDIVIKPKPVAIPNPLRDDKPTGQPAVALPPTVAIPPTGQTNDPSTINSYLAGIAAQYQSGPDSSGQDFRKYFENAIKSSPYASLLNNSNIQYALQELEIDYGRQTSVNGKPVIQPTQCVSWDILTQALPGMENSAKIDGYPLSNAEDIFAIINSFLKENPATKKFPPIEEAISRNKGKLTYPAGVNTAYRFTSIDDIRPGDAYFINGQNHTGRIIGVYDTPEGRVLVASEANRNKDGLPNIYVVTEKDFTSTIGPLKTTVFLRDNNYPEGSTLIGSRQSAQEVVTLTQGGAAKTAKQKLAQTETQTVTKNDYQKCLDDKNSPGECAGILQHIGETIITPAGQKECQPGETKTSGNTIKSCSKSGTWSIRTCQHGITNNQCNPPPPPPPKPVLPPPTTNLKNQFETCSGNNECKSGNCAGAYLSFGEPRLLPGKACVPSLAEQDTGVIAKHQQDLTNTAIVTGIANAPLVPSLVTTAGQFVAAQGGALATTTMASLPAWASGAISTVARTIAPAVAPAAAITTGLAQTALEVNCQVTGNPDTCSSSQSLALMTMAGYQISLEMQGLTAPKVGRNIDEALFNGRIRGYGSNKNIDIVRNYLANRPPSNYSSALYQKTEVVNQPNEWSMFASADDARLAAVVDDIRASLGNPQEYAGGLEIDDIAQAVYARNQPIYSQPYSDPWSKNTLPTQIIRNLGFDTTSNPNNPYWGRALLGDFFGTKPYCVGNLCYQNAALTQATAATYGKTTLVGSYNEWPIPGVPSTPGHAVNLFIEPSTGNLAVVDPTWGMSFPSVEKYYEYLQSIGKSVNLYWNFERIFIPKIK